MTTFGRYEILETLGEGGFATVYRAWDPLLSREVALKALLLHLAANPAMRQRFLSEARVLATLRHPNIVAFFDVIETGDRPFFTMELIQGPTLAALLAGGQQPEFPWVMQVLRSLASAVDYLHGAGLVHRDIKLSNVMLAPGDRVVLMDFGIVRALDHTQYTLTGTPLGTPETMAPEQVRGEPVGPPADIYALGILAYQLLSGHPPFTGDTAHVLYAQVHVLPPPLSEARPGLSVSLYAAVDAALAKDPGQRPAAASAFIRMLDGVDEPPPRETRPAVSQPVVEQRRRITRRQAMIAAGAAATLGGLGVAAALVLRAGGGKSITPEFRAGGTLRLPSGPPTTLDPALAQDTGSIRFVTELFSGLVALDPSLRVQPDLASQWTSSPDGLRHTFRLRDDAVFAGSGRRVTAQDVKYSLERAADPRTMSPTAKSYLGDIVGVSEMLEGRAKEIAGVRVVDDRTVELTLDAPKAYFLAKLTYPTAFIVDREQINREGRDWLLRPNTTGPFRLQDRNSDRLLLSRNERYAGNARPSLATLSFVLTQVVVAQYVNGEVDVFGLSTGDEVARFSDPSEPLNREVVRNQLLSTYYIAFNTTVAPFDDVRVRQAFALATDKQRLAREVFGVTMLPATGILPPGIPAAVVADRTFPFDPSRARALLEESRYARRMPAITLSVQASTTFEIALQEMWRTGLGVNVDVKTMEGAAYAQAIERGDLQLWWSGWEADYADPENFLDLQFLSGGHLNNTRYANENVDQMLKSARAERDQHRRVQTYADAEQQILLDAPWVPIVHPVIYTLVKPYIQGWPNGIFSSAVPIYKYLASSR